MCLVNLRQKSKFKLQERAGVSHTELSSDFVSFLHKAGVKIMNS